MRRRATKRASGRSRARVAKAASISRIVVALRIWICSPMARAASCTSRNVVSALGALAGLTSTATRTALGTSSCRSRSRLAATSWAKKLMPVALPPGRARLATRPSLTGSSPTPKTIGIVAVAALAASAAGVLAGRGDHGHPTADQVSHQRRQAIVLALQPVVLDRHVLAFDVAGFAEAFAERGRIARGGIGRPAVDKPDHRQRRLLRARRERPRYCRAAETRTMNCRLPMPIVICPSPRDLPAAMSGRISRPNRQVSERLHAGPTTKKAGLFLLHRMSPQVAQTRSAHPHLQRRVTEVKQT